jgi:hypothetical protein
MAICRKEVKMILVGILYEGGNLAMPTYAFKTWNDTFLSEEKDIHDAAEKQKERNAA